LYFSFSEKFCRSLIKIFIPVYLFVLGYSISQIGIFLFLYYVIIPVFSIIMLSLTHYVGVKKMMAVGTFSYIISYVLLALLKTGQISFYIPAIFLDLSTQYITQVIILNLRE
ncbi:MAG: hypothetical protein J7L43_00870, partial [Candidatus Aenigmarchaeota archaeon]|nr:hypothetical protein [Candidatus Aenigmarchaeota archaeon]